MNEPRRQFGGSVADAGGVAIDQGLRQYMLGVYNYMALAVAGTGLVSMYLASNEALMYQIAATPLKWLAFGGIVVIGMFVAPRVIFSGSKIAAHAVFWLYAALWGLLIAPMLFYFQQSGAAADIYRAFFISASIFGATSLYGYTTKRDLTSWASILSITGIVLLVALIVQTLFFGASIASLFISSAVVVFISAVTMYETQMIKSMYREGSATNDRAAIFGAFALYGSFVTLFVHVLNILGFMRD